MTVPATAIATGSVLEANDNSPQIAEASPEAAAPDAEAMRLELVRSEPVEDETPETEAAPAPRARKPRDAWAIATVATISFSLTFVVASLGILTGLVPPMIAFVDPRVDVAVVVLMLPLCALVFTMLAEVLRAVFKGVPRTRAPRLMPALSTWRPGRGEG